MLNTEHIIYTLMHIILYIYIPTYYIRCTVRHVVFSKWKVSDDLLDAELQYLAIVNHWSEQ